MTYVFWQGIISIHQKSFLEAVAHRAGTGKVFLVVAHDITPDRKSMGWDVPDIANVTVIRSPSRQQVTELVAAHKDAVHVIGGIKVGTMLTAAFDECIRQGCKVGVMTEPYNHEGIKGMLRTVKYRYFGIKYFRHIQFVLAIGRLGMQQYTRLGYNAARLFPWAYFISVPANAPVANTGTTRIMYAGRLWEAKGISRFLKELVQTGNSNYTFDIYGSGPDEEKMKQLVASKGLTDRIHFYPFLKYDELLQQYARYDWVVLPSSAKDGWGVVVSEGLLNGLKALCSNICGVSRVITEGKNGVVFDWATEGSCKQAIDKMLTCEGFASRSEIKKWAEAGISAEAGAAYFLQIIDNVYQNKTRPGLPWETA